MNVPPAGPRDASALLITAAAFVLLVLPLNAAAKDGVQIREVDGKVQIDVNGSPFTEYHYRDVSRPFLYPILNIDGTPMTRNWPMKQVEGEERDHPHHRSLWWAHGDINGHDFWSEEARAGRTVHEKFTKLKSGKKYGVIQSANKLVAKDGTVVATDETTIRIWNRKDDRMIDYEVTVKASHGPLEFGDTKEGTMAMRLNEALRLVRDRKPGTGHIVNSEGVRDGETWGKRANWVDYHGPVDGKVVGVAIFDSPKNPRHPTWWHVRDYGLFAANPFGIHDFEKKPAKAGNLTVPAGGKITFRYRFYFHRGDEKEGRVAEQYAEYAR